MKKRIEVLLSKSNAIVLYIDDFFNKVHSDKKLE